MSYGPYQLATGAGMPQAFLRTEGRAWAGEFGGARPGTPAFDRAWTRITAREPERFEQAQHAFILRER